MAARYCVTCTDCPFERTYSSRAKADFGFSRHSCEQWLRIADLKARGRARSEAIDRTPKPCLHKEADHQHGTYACYVLDRCRCLGCAKANSAYEANRVRQQAYGRWNGLVDAEPARQHVRALMAQGMGLKRIAAVGEVAHGLLWKLMYGKQNRDGNCKPSGVRRMHGDKSVSVTPAERAEVVRRLLATDVSWKEIERRTGINVHRLQREAS